MFYVNYLTFGVDKNLTKYTEAASPVYYWRFDHWNDICKRSSNYEEIFPMKRLSIIFCALIFTCSSAFGASTILKMSKSEDRDSLQAFISFSTMPRYETQLTGKRLDIILKQTILDEKVVLIKEDDKIIKVLARPNKDDTELSFFFRYVPQKVSFSVSDNTTLVADVLLGNRLQALTGICPLIFKVCHNWKEARLIMPTHWSRHRMPMTGKDFFHHMNPMSRLRYPFVFMCRNFRCL